MRQKTFFSASLILFSLIAMAGYGQEDNPLLNIRILEKRNPQDLKVQSPPNKGPWSEIKLTRGLLTVNGKAQGTYVGGTPGSTVKIKAGDLTRIYPGQITVSAVSDHWESNPSTSSGEKQTELLILNQVSLTDYVACVTAFESA